MYCPPVLPRSRSLDLVIEAVALSLDDGHHETHTPSPVPPGRHTSSGELPVSATRLAPSLTPRLASASLPLSPVALDVAGLSFAPSAERMFVEQEAAQAD